MCFLTKAAGPQPWLSHLHFWMLFSLACSWKYKRFHHHVLKLSEPIAAKLKSVKAIHLSQKFLKEASGT